MISDVTQLQGTLGQIAWASDALEGLRRDVNEENALVFPVLAEGFISHIRTMTAEACEFVERMMPADQADYHFLCWKAASRPRKASHQAA